MRVHAVMGMVVGMGPEGCCGTEALRLVEILDVGVLECIRVEEVD